MDYLQKAKRVFDVELAEVGRLSRRLDESFSRAIETILESVEKRGKIVVVGVGKSGHIGDKIAATLTSTGSPAVVLNSLNALHGDLGVVADGDVVLALSYSGETEELTNILPALSRFEVKIIAMTGNPRSFLAQNSHVHLDVSIEQEACPLNLAPTSSTTAMLVLGDALAMVLLEARGFKKEDFARYHPGGRLGRALLLKVSQIMRNGEQIAVVAPETTIRRVLHEMARRRAGSAIVSGEDRRLLGIFTHGDFGRHFQKEPDLLEKRVGDYMTKNPITIGSDKLAVEVLNVLERHRIDDLVVVDEQNVPVGIVDSQDLARFKLL
jgi:arabinose-5-phosphate isomerase